MRANQRKGFRILLKASLARMDTVLLFGVIPYSAFGLAKMIVDGKQLPELTQETIDQGNAQHAKKHANSTKEEVLGILREKGTSVAEYVAGLVDADLDLTSSLAVAGGTISVQKIIENIIIHSGTEHLTSMRSATGM